MRWPSPEQEALIKESTKVSSETKKLSLILNLVYLALAGADYFSDHTLDYSDFIIAAWFLTNTTNFLIWGGRQVALFNRD